MTDQARDAGLDIIRAVSIVLVVIWHLQPMNAEMLPATTAVALWGGWAIKIFYLNISLLAVPSLILISLYLFVAKLSEDENYWKKRFLRLLQIYVFWVGIQFILYLLSGGPLPLPLKTIIRSGGPDLSFPPLIPSMPSIFYFLYILIFCTVLTFLFQKLPDKIKLILATVVVLGSCLYFLIIPLYGIGIDTRSMKNYYVYVPVAYYLYHAKQKFVQYRWLFLISFVLSAIAEWTFIGMTASAYGRLPIFLGTLALVSFFISGWTAASLPIILLSRFSLGIFALHGYCFAAVVGLFALLQGQTSAFSVQTFSGGILLLAVTFGLTCFCVWLLAKTKLRKYVS